MGAKVLAGILGNDAILENIYFCNRVDVSMRDLSKSHYLTKDGLKQLLER